MKPTKYSHPFITLSVLLCCWSCIDRTETAPVVSNDRVEVRIAPPSTRTALGDDGVTTEWVKNDRIALWAFSGSGSAVFEQEPFTFWSNKADRHGAFFVGSVPAMPVGSYRYYAAYPYPDDVAGTRVTYEIPAEQDGTWRGELDVMLASAEAPELVAADPDRLNDVNELALGFSHKIHVLKVTIPTGRNLFERPVTTLRIRFPRPVAGRMTWDLAAPDETPSMEGTNDAVTLRFARPIGEGDSFWVFIAPGDMRGGEVLFTASDGTEFTWPLSSSAFGNCTAGRITSVNLTLPEIRPSHDLRITVNPTNLGEAVTEINSIVCSDGYVFPDLDIQNRTERVTPNGDGTFSVRVFDDMGVGFPDNTVSMTVGSTNAEGVFGRKCEVSDATASSCTIKAPYLFFEDFSGMTSFNAGGSDLASNPTCSDLSQYGLPGWYGARTQGEEGASVRIRLYGNGLVYYPARLDSAPISSLRENSTVRVSVVFNASVGGASTSKMRCILGTSSDNGGFQGNDAISSITTLSSIATSDSYTNIPGEYSFEVGSCTRNTRLAWQTSKDGWISGYSNIYLDNIRVTIVP